MGDGGVDPRTEAFLESWLGLLRRRWPPGLLVFTCVAALAAAVVFLSHPIYRAEARLRLGEPPPMSGVSPAGGIFALMRLGGDPFANDLELLASRTLAEGVVVDGALAAVLDAPRGWHRDSLLLSLSATREADKALFEVEWRGDGKILVRQVAPREAVVATALPGERLRFGGLAAAFHPWREGMPRRIRIRTLPFGEAVRQTRSRIVAERARREANVVDLSYDHPDPALARAVVAAAIDRFVELRAAVQRRESGETVDSLESVANHTRRELEIVEAALEELQRSARLVAPDAQSEAFIERYAESSAELELARAERAGIAERLRRVDGPTGSGEVWTGLAAFPRFLENHSVGELLRRRTQLQAQRVELGSRRSEESRALHAIDDQIEALDASLRSLAGAYHEALDERVRVLEAEVAGMDREFSGLPEKVIELGRHQRQVRLLSEILVVTEQRLRQEQLRQALTFSNVQVIDPPALRYKPVWPRKKLGLAVGLLLASGFGLLAVVVAERADRTIRRAAEVRGTIGLPVLAAGVGRRPGELSFTPAEARAVLGYADADERGFARLTLAPVGEEASAHEIARALRESVAGEAAERPGAAPGTAPVTLVAPRVDGFAAARAAAAEGAPVVLAVEHGRTPRWELRRAARLLDEAGGRVIGVIVLCDRARDAAAVWT